MGLGWAHSRLQANQPQLDCISLFSYDIADRMGDIMEDFKYQPAWLEKDVSKQVLDALQLLLKQEGWSEHDSRWVLATYSERAFYC